MQAISSVINKLKDGYLKAVNWIATHPHIALWSGGAVAVLAVVALVL